MKKHLLLITALILGCAHSSKTMDSPLGPDLDFMVPAQNQNEPTSSSSEQENNMDDLEEAPEPPAPVETNPQSETSSATPPPAPSFSQQDLQTFLKNQNLSASSPSSSSAPSATAPKKPTRSTSSDFNDELKKAIGKRNSSSSSSISTEENSAQSPIKSDRNSAPSVGHLPHEKPSTTQSSSTNNSPSNSRPPLFKPSSPAHGLKSSSPFSQNQGSNQELEQIKKTHEQTLKEIEKTKKDFDDIQKRFEDRLGKIEQQSKNQTVPAVPGSWLPELTAKNAMYLLSTATGALLITQLIKWGLTSEASYNSQVIRNMIELAKKKKLTVTKFDELAKQLSRVPKECIETMRNLVKNDAYSAIGYMNLQVLEDLEKEHKKETVLNRLKRGFKMATNQLKELVTLK